MNGFKYDPDDKWYLGKTPLTESPLEPGVFLVPEHVTIIKPMDRTAGVWQKYDTSSRTWSLVAVTAIERQSIKAGIDETDRKAERLLMKILEAYALDDTNRLARLKSKYSDLIRGRTPD